MPSNFLNRTILCFIILLCSSCVVSGGLSEDVATSFKEGLDRFVIGLVDSFLETTISDEYGTGEGSIALDAVFSFGTYTINPFEMEGLQKFKDVMLDLFFDIWEFLLLLTIIIVIVMILFPTDNLASLYNSTGFDSVSGFKTIIFVLIFGIFVLMCESVFIWLVLKVNDEFSKSIILGSFNAVAFTPGNIILYSIMGLAYGLLALCFIYRTFIIMFFFGTSPIFGVMLLFPGTQEFAIKAHMYFIQIVFYQFAIVLWYSFCIFVLDIAGKGVIAYNIYTGYYLIMVLISVYASYRFIFHLDFVRMGSQITRIVLIKKL